MILEALAIATMGYVAPATVVARAPLPLPIGSHGYIVEQPAGGMADPTSHFREPFDRQFYEWKYGRELRRQRDKIARPSEPVPPRPVERDRPNFLPELMERDRVRAELEALDQRNRETERDIAALEAYIEETTATIEADLAAALAATEAQALAKAERADAIHAEALAAWQAIAERQEAIIAALERDVAEARNMLTIALERRRIHQNQLAAIEAVIRIYF